MLAIIVSTVITLEATAKLKSYWGMIFHFQRSGSWINCVLSCCILVCSFIFQSQSLCFPSQNIVFWKSCLNSQNAKLVYRVVKISNWNVTKRKLMTVLLLFYQRLSKMQMNRYELKTLKWCNDDAVFGYEIR